VTWLNKVLYDEMHFSVGMNIGEENFAQWVRQIDSNNLFDNGLELVLWFYMERQKK
jgi:hypothetical protein